MSFVSRISLRSKELVKLCKQMFCPQINMSEESIKMEEREEFNLESATMSTENLSETGTDGSLIKMIKIVH